MTSPSESESSTCSSEDSDRPVEKRLERRETAAGASHENPTGQHATPTELPHPAGEGPGTPAKADVPDTRDEGFRPADPVVERQGLPPTVGKPSVLGQGFWAGPKYPWPIVPSNHSRDFELDLGTVGDLCVIGASARGGLHRFEGSERQDAFALSKSTTGRYLLIAIADGLSSAPTSRRTAFDLVHHTTDWIGGRIDGIASEPDMNEELVRELVLKCLNEGVARINADRPTPSSRTAGASTLTWAIVPTVECEARTVHFGGVGDSSAWTISGGRWKCQSQSPDEAIASSATAALPVHDPERAAWFGETTLDADDVFALTTDGVANALGDGTTQVATFLAEKWRTPPEPLAFLADLQFDRKSFDDDRTAVLVWQRPQ